MLVTQQSKPVLCLKVNKNDHARMQLTGICVMSYDDMYFFLIYLLVSCHSLLQGWQQMCWNYSATQN